ncbi:MAG TPA: LuxR C-terminal-related transcriptional regulator [Anaerolineaceae bacterium]|nr:LuxR C-terminal-related transcriptional regulator [Anaerolineaceae bacterium]
MDSSQLLHTKISVPVLPEQRIARQPLFEKLEMGIHPDARLTLISAPAGFGKTTLVNSLVRSFTLPTAWLSLDERDNDPMRFFAYLIAAFQAVEPTIGQAAAAILQAPPTPLSGLFFETVLTQILNELAEKPAHWLVVLDDYHLIAQPLIHDTLTFGVDHFPPNLHLFLTTRSDPPWPLSRWRARRQLVEMRAQDLRLSEAEAAGLLNGSLELHLDEDDIVTLQKRTEGWIAGLQLAGIALQNWPDSPNRRQFIQQFSGSHGFVLDYLSEEVFNRLSERLRTFLQGTAILERFNASLCQAVSGEADSQSLLKTIFKSNLFLIPLDASGDWFRYHALFSDLLRQQLRESLSEVEIAGLHRRAAAWFETEGAIEEAIDHWLAAKEFSKAAQLIARAGRQAFVESKIATLERWLRLLPDVERLRIPELCLLQAWVELLTGQLDESDRLVARVEAGEAEGTPQRGEAAAIRANLRMIRGEPIPNTIAEAQRALAWLPAEDAFSRSLVLLAVGAGYRFQGDTIQAVEAFTESYKLSARAGQVQTAILAAYNLGSAYVVQGKLHLAAKVYEGALAQAELPGGSYLPSAGILWFGLAEVEYEWDQLEAADQGLRKAVRLSQEWNYLDMLISSRLLLAQVWLAQHKASSTHAAFSSEGTETYPEVAAELAQVEALLQGNPMISPQSVQRAGAVIARMHLDMNRQGEALSWAARMPTPSDADLHRLDLEYLTLAKALILTGLSRDISSALGILGRLEKGAREAGRQGSLVQILAGQAVAYQVDGQHLKAKTIFKQALALGEAEVYRRTFLDWGFPASQILAEIQIEGGQLSAYARDLYGDLGEPMPGAPAPRPQPLVESLTERELAVLRLMSRGFSNPQIGKELILATGTVKKYTSNIFQKLGVNNRTQALLRAQELGLL